MFDYVFIVFYDFVIGFKDGSMKVSVLMKLKGCNVFFVVDNVFFCECMYFV